MSGKNEELKNRTKEFAHRCVKLGIALPDNSLGNHLRGQLTRSSTSVAANYRAALLGQSKAMCKAKISIVLEEADESAFWLEFCKDEKLVKSGAIDSLLKEAKELTAIFFSTRKTLAGQKK